MNVTSRNSAYNEPIPRKISVRTMPVSACTVVVDEAPCAGARSLIHNNSAGGNRHRSNADLSRYWLVVRAVSGSYVHALSGFFYACGKARSLARDVATFSCLAADASERNVGGFAGCPARLPRGNERRGAGGDFREQPVLLDDGAGLSDFDGNCVRFAEHGALYGRGACVAAPLYHCPR